jgi:hypothetical protein
MAKGETGFQQLYGLYSQNVPHIGANFCIFLQRVQTFGLETLLDPFNCFAAMRLFDSK